MSMEYTAVPVEDPEKAQLLDAEGAPAPAHEAAPPQHEDRCSWARPRWMTHHHCDHGDCPHLSPHHLPHRRGPPRFVRILLRLFFLGLVLHMAFYAYHGRRCWSSHGGRRHGHPHSHGDLFPNDDASSEEWHEEYLFDEAFNLDLSSDHPPPHRPPACDPKDLVPWDGPSEFSISPEDFGTLVIIQRGRSDHGKIYLHESPDVDEVIISISILVADDKLASGIHVAVHEDFDKGVYKLDLSSTFRRIGPGCLKLVIDVTFPSELGSFNTFISGGNVDIVAHSVSNIIFENIMLKTFNGTISSKSINANKAFFHAFYGQVKGSVDLLEDLKVAVFLGKIDIEVNTLTTSVGILARVAHGSAHIKVPGELYSGSFKVITHVGQVDVEAEDADSLVIEKSNNNLAIGYYKEKEGGKILLFGGAHSVANLTFV